MTTTDELKNVNDTARKIIEEELRSLNNQLPAIWSQNMSPETRENLRRAFKNVNLAHEKYELGKDISLKEENPMPKTPNIDLVNTQRLDEIRDVLTNLHNLRNSHFGDDELDALQVILPLSAPPPQIAQQKTQLGRIIKGHGNLRYTFPQEIDNTLGRMPKDLKGQAINRTVDVQGQKVNIEWIKDWFRGSEGKDRVDRLLANFSQPNLVRDMGQPGFDQLLKHVGANDKVSLLTFLQTPQGNKVANDLKWLRVALKGYEWAYSKMDAYFREAAIRQSNANTGVRQQPAPSTGNPPA